MSVAFQESPQRIGFHLTHLLHPPLLHQLTSCPLALNQFKVQYLDGRLPSGRFHEPQLMLSTAEGRCTPVT